MNILSNQRDKSDKVKKRFQYLLIPIIFLSIFNVFNIILSLKGDLYGTRIKMSLNDYFIGLPLIPLFVVLFFLLYLLIRKKISRKKFSKYSIFTLLIYLITINLALFPEMQKKQFFDGGWELQRKSDSSLIEALEESPASWALKIKSYVRIDELLHECSLILPKGCVIETDFFFHALVEPRSLEWKEYDYELSGDDFSDLLKSPMNSFPVERGLLRGIEGYYVLESISREEKIILLMHRKWFVFVPLSVFEERFQN